MDLHISRKTEGYLPSLDGLRALAAIAVIVAHHQPGPTLSGWNDLLAAVHAAAAGQLAVVVFFVLSSFLLGAQLCREYDTTGTIDRRRFLIRRARRIWPLYFFAVAVIAFVLPTPIAMIHENDYGYVHRHLWVFAAFLGNYSLALSGAFGWPNNFGPPLNTLWTIAVEQHFYIAVAILMPVILRAKQPLYWCTSLLLVGIAGRLIWVAWPALRPIDLNLYVASTSYIDVMLVGCIAGVGWARHEKQITALIRLSGTGIAVSLLAALSHQVLSYPSFGDNRFAIVALYGAASSSMAIGMLWLLANPEHQVSQWLGCRPLQALGTLSYGLYVWHMPVEAAFRTAITPWTALASIVTLPLVILATIAVATISYFVIERPFFRKPKTPRGQTQAPAR